MRQDNAKIILKREDFVSDQEVRWCPGCGDYAILATMQKTLPLLGIPRENLVFISGIGCSSRFPYYLETYGFHTIHGRAPTIATGLKMARPDLHVFVITGDGDGLSIGSNHLLHLMRRNVNLTVLLFNNRIYGLTKGQVSPTSEMGKKTKSSPFGSHEQGVDPIRFALGADCSFIARAIDVDAKGLQTVITKAVEHQGTSFIEIYQNCNVFNDGAFANLSDRGLRDDNTLFLEPGKPMIFGSQEDKGMVLEEGKFKPVQGSSDYFIHQNNLDPSLLWQLMHWQQPEFPVATGIFRQVERPTLDHQVHSQLRPSKPVEHWLRQGATWEVDR